MQTINHWEIVNSGLIVTNNTPLELWQNAVRYFKHCDENPIVTKTTLRTGKDSGKAANIEHQRPYTVKGLCLHCGILQEYLNDVRNTKDKDSEMYIVVSKILYIIYVQNVEMATVGEYSPVFVSKMLNLDKDDGPAGRLAIEIVSGLPALSNSENEVLEKLELEKPNTDFDY